MTDQNMLNAPKASCYTKIATETYENIWTIENFTNCKHECLVSSDFSTGSGQKITWCHLLWPARYNQNIGQVNTVLETFIKSCDVAASLNATIKVKILQTDQTPKVHITSGPVKKGERIGGYSMTIPHSALIAEKNSYLTNNVLQLRIQLVITCTLPSQGGNTKITVPTPQLIPQVSSLFGNRKYSDVTIAVGPEEFYCHKAMLAVRSSVFAAMFEHEMEESRQNRVTITDIEPEVFQEFLRFIYTDQVQNMNEMAIYLLPVADKYGIDRLKALCEQNLCTNLSVESACTILVLADMHRAEQLKRESIAYICKNRAVLRTEAWRNLHYERIDLINDILVEAFAGFQKL